ncbi:hypothetical protein SBV1_370061 [Verrucomicrobia bacterium]|nr:hypothetical protein SBV1_370061 [Verrucomicrobiota bacterium]
MFTNASGPCSRNYRQFAPLRDLPATASNDQLEFGAANLNAKVVPHSTSIGRRGERRKKVWNS